MPLIKGIHKACNWNGVTDVFCCTHLTFSLFVTAENPPDRRHELDKFDKGDPRTPRKNKKWELDMDFTLYK